MQSPGASGGLGKSGWIVLGVVALAFVGLVLVVMKMQSDHGGTVDTCEERCKASPCGTEDPACATMCSLSPSKVIDCVESSGSTCDTIRQCVIGGP